MTTDNAFSRFEIRHLSASNLNLFISNLPLWIVTYLAKFETPKNAAMLRGDTIDLFIGKMLQFQKSAEGGWEKTGAKISDEEIEKDADKFFNSALKNVDDEPEKISNEKASVNKYLKAAMPFYKQLGAPTGYQTKIDLDIGLPVNLIGYADLTYEGSVRDMKTSARALKELPPPVQRQLSIYATALDVPLAVADYIVATKTRSEVITLECDDITKRFDEVYRAAAAMQNLLHNNDINSLIAQCYPDFQDWRWNKSTIEKAKSLWSIK